MTDAKYFVRTGVHYAVPLNPGIYDVNIGATVSHVTRSRREAEHNDPRRYFRTNKAVEYIIKNQLKKDIPPYLVIEIEDEITGLNNTDIIDILDHVQQRRGKTNGNLIDENSVRFREPFDATLGVAAYIRRIEECQQIAGDSGEGWSDFQLVQAEHTRMVQSGLYTDAYLIWQRRTQAQKTWVAFKMYWTDTFQEH